MYAADVPSKPGYSLLVGDQLCFALYAASLAARLRGRRGRARLLGFAGMTSMTVAGYLGGYLSFSRGLGVKRPEGQWLFRQPKEVMEQRWGAGLVAVHRARVASVAKRPRAAPRSR